MSQSKTIGAPISSSLRLIIEKRKKNAGFETDTEYIRWLIREDLNRSGLLGEKMNETPNQIETAKRPQPA